MVSLMENGLVGQLKLGFIKSFKDSYPRLTLNLFFPNILKCWKEQNVSK